MIAAMSGGVIQNEIVTFGQPSLVHDGGPERLRENSDELIHGSPLYGMAATLKVGREVCAVASDVSPRRINAIRLVEAGGARRVIEVSNLSRRRPEAPTITRTTHNAKIDAAGLGFVRLVECHLDDLFYKTPAEADAAG